jgi:hypothetical protein
MDNLIELLDQFKQLLRWTPFIPIVIVIVGGVIYWLLGCGEYRRESLNSYYHYEDDWSKNDDEGEEK